MTANDKTRVMNIGLLSIYFMQIW